MIDENGSTYPDEWEDRVAAARYLLHATEVFERGKLYRDKAFQSHVEYAKWLLASLLAVHGGVIYAVSNLRTSVPRSMLPGLIGSAGWSLIGIGCTLVTGLFIWLNFQFAEQSYTEWSNPSVLYNTAYFPRDNGRYDPIHATMLAAVGFGLLSGLSFALSAVTVIGTLSQ